MVRIVVEEDQFLGAAFHHNIDRFTPVAVAPAAFPGGVLLRQILRVIDEDVRAFRELAHVLVEDGVSRLIVSGIDNHFIFGLNAEAEASLGMIEPHGLDNAIVECDAVFFDVIKMPVRRHLTHVHRKVRIGHLFFDGPLQSAATAGGMEEKIVVRVGIKRKEEWNALNVVPMKVRQKNVSVDGSILMLGVKLLAQITKAGAAIENIDLAVDAHFNAGGITPVAQIF